MLTFQNRRFGSTFTMCPQELPAVRLKNRLFLQKPDSARLHRTHLQEGETKL